MTLHKVAAIVIGTLAVTCISPAHQKEPKHAPSIEVCRADVAVWYSEEPANEYTDAQVKWLDDGVPNRTDIAKLPIPELFGRMREMMDCRQVDSERHTRYSDAVSFYDGIVGDRTLRFIVRHGLIEQLKKEDAAGKR